ncbi:MAG: CDP-glycerol glycerophosphotransferase family protein [Fusobacterium sp.]|nr:CDP-glycerol glycerophosphotransferase family protein [Fusobacterium sp.]
MVKIKAYLKYTLIIIIENFLKILWLFPLKKNRVLFFSFNGKQFSDSPKYIYENLNEFGKNKEIVWSFINSKNKTELKEKNVKKVEYMSLHFIFVFVTSKFIITNNFVSSYLPVRKKQILLNTWHGGSPLKTVGLAQEDSTEYDLLFFKEQEKKYKAFLSSSTFMTREVFQKSMNYNGKILEFGMPRNSILFKKNNEIIDKVYNYLKISMKENIGIVLYAPTFRGTASNSSFLADDEQFSIEEVISELEKKFNKKFIFLFRAHHAMRIKINSEKVIDASNYPDMQELLSVADVLITDYSSCMGDMSLTKKPVFLYVPDLKEYTKDRGFYWDIYSLPFPLAKTQKTFLEEIKKFNLIKYKEEVNKYLEKLGNYETEKSIQKTIKWLEEQEKQ